MRCLLLLFSICFLSACASNTKSPVVSRTLSNILKQSIPSKKGGGYYADDGPHSTTPSHLDFIPSAKPQWEPLNKATMKPYTVLGKRYVPNKTLKPYKEKGIASWYGKKFHGKKTSIGEPYDMYAMTAAHKTLALPSYAKVTRVSTGKSIIVRLTDRGPFHAGRIIDLSYTAAHQLGIIEKGSDWVIVEAIIPAQNQTSFVDLKKNTQIVATKRGKAASDLSRHAEDTLTKRLKENVAQLEALLNQQEDAFKIEQIEQAIDKDFDALEAFAENIEDSETLNAIQHAETLAEQVVEKAQIQKNKQLEKTLVQAKQFFVQLGAFSNQDNAQNAKSRFLADLPWLGNAVHIQQQGKLYRVQIGPYESRHTAQKLIQRIQKETGFQPALHTP